MLKFELKRIIRGREIMGLLVSITILVMASFFNTIFVQPMYDGDRSLVLDFYQAVSQLMPLVFAPVIGNYFTKDYENKTLFFYRNQGISVRRYFFIRLGVFILVGSMIGFAVCASYLLFRKIDVLMTFSVSFVIILAYIYTVLLISLLAICSKRRMFTIIGAIAGTIVISLINIMPIPYLKGNWFLLDFNSHVADDMETIIETAKIVDMYKVLIPFIVWISVVILMEIFIISFQVKRKEKK